MFFKNQRIGKYQILDTIGTGGFGSVYLARDVFIDKAVAIKVPHKQGDDVEKLLQEPRLLAALNHPNIVSVLTAEQTNNVFYIVMEYVEGTSLERFIRLHGALPVDQALAWFVQIVDALAYAHRKNIIHRDIRPANILISREGQVKVGDFGTSRYLDGDHFASTRIGSPPYMAPEHFQGKANYQSDLYSMGVLMYECLTNKLPFYDKSPQRLAQIVREASATPIQEHNPLVPAEFGRVVERAMEKKLSLRYPSAEALLRDLRQLRLEPAPPAAPLPPPPRPESAAVREAQAEPQHSPEPREKKLPFLPKDLPTREISRLFCWNCSRPIQKRTKNCPHCNEPLD